MDKSASKERFVRDGVPTPAFVEIEAEWHMERRLEAAGVLELPVVVKPVNEGSSVGVTRVEDEARLATAIDHALEFDHRAMLEEFIPGRELTVGIVDGKPLPIIELLFEGHMFTYQIKYTKGAASHIVRPDLPEDLEEQIQEHAVAAHRSLRCRGCTRVDFRVTDDGDPYVLEVNTIPGMTETSLLPDAARAVGMSFAELCEAAIDMALRDRATRPIRA
jgi:D-alanine-D-alanine ligase